MNSQMLRGFRDEFEKIALNRMEQEISKGTVRRSDIVPGSINSTSGIGNVAGKQLLRRSLATPAPVDPVQLARSRAISDKLYNTQAAHPEAMGLANATVNKAHAPGVGPAMVMGDIYAPPDSPQFMRNMTSGSSVGQLRGMAQTIPNAPKFIGGASRPEDPTLRHAILRHEGGEAATLGEGKLRFLASHAGVRPLLEEQMAVRNDPVAAKALRGMRHDGGDNQLIYDRAKQMGALPNQPLPIGGRHERTLNRQLDKNPKALSRQARGRSLGTAIGASIGNPREGAKMFPYVPKDAAQSGLKTFNRAKHTVDALSKFDLKRAGRQAVGAVKSIKPALDFMR